MTPAHWATRTIKDGKVRIGGRTFTPSDQWKEYDGRLDGMRYLFGRYWQGDEELNMVCLWGPAEYAKLNPDSPEAEAFPRPEIVDDYFVWQFWHTEEATK